MRIRKQFALALAVSGFLTVQAAVSEAKDLCLQITGGHIYVLKKVSPKIGAAKGKPFGGFRVSPIGTYMGPLYGSAATQSTKASLMITFTAPKIEIGPTGGGSVLLATEFHQINFLDADGEWNVGDTAGDCNWTQQSGSIINLTCPTITAIDCSTVVIP